MVMNIGDRCVVGEHQAIRGEQSVISDRSAEPDVANRDRIRMKSIEFNDFQYETR